jgi:hypothetical protein
MSYPAVFLPLRPIQHVEHLATVGGELRILHPRHFDEIHWRHRPAGLRCDRSVGRGRGCGESDQQAAEVLAHRCSFRWL